MNDRPFYVMGFVDGYVLRDVAGTEAVLDEATRKVAGEQLIDVLAAIHQVDVDAVGLGDFARHDGYIERQLRRWHGQFGKSQEQAREIGVYRPVPLVGRGARPADRPAARAAGHRDRARRLPPGQHDHVRRRAGSWRCSTGS